MIKMDNPGQQISSRDFATFLYDELVPYDKSARDIGLLKGGFVSKVYIHIFNGRSVAMDGLNAPKTRVLKGDLMSLSSATPETIAYAACMVSGLVFKDEIIDVGD